MGLETNDLEDDFYSEENLSKVNNVDLSSKEDTSEKESQEAVKVDEDSTDVEEVDEETVAKSYTISLGDLGIDDEEEMELEGEEEEAFSPEERLKSFADSIMSNCLGNRPLSKFATDTLFSLSSPSIFRDENYIIYSVLYQFRGKLRSINIDEEFLKLYLNRNRGLLQKAKSFIDINAYGEVDGSVELGYIGGVLKHYKRLLTLPDLSEVEYNTLIEKYCIEYRALEAEKVLMQAQTILTEGLSLGRSKYFGFEDSYNFIRRRLAEIEGIGDADKGTGFISAKELLLEEKEVNKSYKISDFDKLEALNNVYGGIYTGMFYQVIAPPKGGKTKLMSRIAHTTSVKYGNNVTVWAVEGGSDAFLSEIRAIHFDYTYNTGASVLEKKYGVTQDVIAHNKFPNDELKQLEMSSKLDLASNESYGKIDFIERPFNVETFITDIDTSVSSNNSQIVIIDYLQLIGSERNMQERERVAEAYKSLLKYCRSHNVAVITPGQYKQESIKALMEKNSTSDSDMRIAGGSSAEVIRTPDIIFALWASTQDLLNNSMKILSVPCRFNKPFPEINCVVDLGVSQFISQ